MRVINTRWKSKIGRGTFTAYPPTYTSTIIAPRAPSSIVASITPSSGIVGQIFTASASGDRGYLPGAFTYVWELDGTPIEGATSNTYESVEAGDLTVVITCTNASGFDDDESDPVVVSNIPADGIGAMIIGSTFEVA